MSATWWRPAPAQSRLSGAEANPDSTQSRLPEQLELTTLRRLDGLLRGDHRGLVTGAGTERGEAREYLPGQDEVRAIDWAVTARTTVPHIRTTIADRNITMLAIADLSASMFFGTALAEKRTLAIGAVAAFGFLAAASGDRCGTVIGHGSGLHQVAPMSGRHGVHYVVRQLLAIPETPTTGPAFPEVIRRSLRSYPHRGIRIVVSDFADLDVLPQIAALATRHTVIAIQVTDPTEHELPAIGHITVQDPETGRLISVNSTTPRTRKRYADAADAHYTAVQHGLRRAGCAHLCLRTDRDWVLDLARFVKSYRAITRSLSRAAAEAR